MKNNQRKSGGKRAGAGRPKGVPNKATALAREAIAKFVDANSARLQGWLDEIAAEEGAKAAFNCFMDVVEYHVPKLARHEHSDPNGQPMQAATVMFVNAAPPKS